MAKRNWSEIEHPRGNFTWQDLPQAHQQAGHAAMESLGGENAPMIRAHVAGELASTEKDIRGLEKKRQPVPATMHRRLALLQKGHEEAQSIPPTGMEASVARIHATAMMPVKAQRALVRKGGEMQAPVAGEFYPGRHAIGKAIGDVSFGKNTEGSYRMQIASPILSARMPPQHEVRAAAGMAAVMRGSSEIGIHLGHHAARYLSEGLEGSADRPPIEAGKYSLAEMSQHRPDAAALLLQHGAMQQGLVTSKTDQSEWTENKRTQMAALGGRSGARLSIPEGLHIPTATFVSGFGITGWPKGGRAMERFHADPSEFGDFAMHKIPSYTWNIHEAGDIAVGTHHFLGALTHGSAWFEAHPEAEEHIRSVSQHPAWSDPTSTIDVWSGRIATGLPYHVARALGESSNPEKIMKLGGVAGLAGVKRPEGGRAIGKASDLGYLYGEEAHRQAGAKMTVKLPGGGRVAMPGHVAQSLSWFGGQAEEYGPDIKSGAKTLTPTSMQDPRGLNPLQFPKTWRP